MRKVKKKITHYVKIVVVIVMIDKFIKTMRKKARLSQLELAKKCNIANTTISGYETGYREPDFETLLNIAEQCGFQINFVGKNKEILNVENITRKEL